MRMDGQIFNGRKQCVGLNVNLSCHLIITDQVIYNPIMDWHDSWTEFQTTIDAGQFG